MVVFNTTCPVPAGAANYGVRGSAWPTMVYIAIVACIVTFGISGVLMFQHLQRYRAPKEQRQILRIVFSIMVYSAIALIELLSYQAAIYIDPLGDLYEAFGLCALFLLFVQYAAPTNKFNEDTLTAARASLQKDPGYDWVRVAWVFVFQYPVVNLMCLITQEVTEPFGHFCVQSLDPQFAHLWLEIAESISITACVLAIVKVYNVMMVTMKTRRGLSKILMFKTIVGLRFFQAWVFSTLQQQNVIKVSSTFSYNDIIYGIPAVLMCAEMVLFSGGFWYAFSSTEYSSRAKPDSPRRSFFGAVLHAANPADLFLGFIQVIPFCSQLSRSGDWRGWRIDFVNSGTIGWTRRWIANRLRPSTGAAPPICKSSGAMWSADSNHNRDDSGTSHNEEYPMVGMSKSLALYDKEISIHAPSHGSAIPSPLHSPPPAGHWNGQRFQRPPSPDSQLDYPATFAKDMV